MSKKYKEVKLTINKVYTKAGDSGETYLVGGQKISKDHLRVCSYGEIDELIALVGGCRESIIYFNQTNIKNLLPILKRIQNELFNVGNMLATTEGKVYNNMPQVDKNHIKNLEEEIDFYNKKLPVLKSFILPGGSDINIWFHLSRTVCRRAERSVVKLSNNENIDTNIIKYLNRLSDALFVWSRWINYTLNLDESIWNPNEE